MLLALLQQNNAYYSYIMIALFGALGSITRHFIGTAISWNETSFPWAIFLVNVSGSAAIAYISKQDFILAHPNLLSGLVIGFLGAFTTFSAFSLQTITLIHNGLLGLAVLYVIGSLVAAFTACYLLLIP